MREPRWKHEEGGVRSATDETQVNHRGITQEKDEREEEVEEGAKKEGNLSKRYGNGPGTGNTK